MFDKRWLCKFAHLYGFVTNSYQCISHLFCLIRKISSDLTIHCLSVDYNNILQQVCLVLKTAKNTLTSTLIEPHLYLTVILNYFYRSISFALVPPSTKEYRWGILIYKKDRFRLGSNIVIINSRIAYSFKYLLKS